MDGCVDDLELLELNRRGLAHHERFEDEDALPFFLAALEDSPACPNALYNKANTLHMLGRDKETIPIFKHIVDTPESELRRGCEELFPTPRSLILDSYFMLFATTLEETRPWKTAIPFLRKHLQRRARGLESLWSKAQIIADAEDLRVEYSQRSKPVSSWAL